MSYFFKNLNFGIFHNLSLFFTSCIKEYNAQLANDKAAYDAANNALDAEKKFTSALQSIYNREFHNKFDDDYYEFYEFCDLSLEEDEFCDYLVNNISNLKACSKEMNEWIASIKRKYDKQIVELSPNKKCQDEEPCELKKTDLNLLKSNMKSALELMSKYNEQIVISTSHDASMKFYQFLMINSAKYALESFISRFLYKFCPAICPPH